jgi:hypothetical protein
MTLTIDTRNTLSMERFALLTDYLERRYNIMAIPANNHDANNKTYNLVTRR